MTDKNSVARKISKRPGPDPIGADGVREYARRKLPPSAVCVVCGERDATVLRQRERTLLEAHHVAEEANDPELTVPLCLNCHRRQTNNQDAVGVVLDRDPSRSILEKLIGLLRGLGVFFEALARSLVSRAASLEQFVDELDAAMPEWRSLPGASS